jgi:hypothetical protein
VRGGVFVAEHLCNVTIDPGEMGSAERIDFGGLPQELDFGVTVT